MAAVCPACGVPVVPGYVRCPKCHKPLPIVRFRGKPPTVDPGGTALDTGGSKLPIGAIVLGVLAVGAVIAVIAVRARKHETPAAPPPVVEAPVGTEVATPTAPAPVAPTAPPSPAVASSAPQAGQVANDLERLLGKQHLWSTVEVVADRVDVRSASCADPKMVSALDGFRATFKAAGLTHLRCLEQSGRVVVDRSL